MIHSFFRGHSYLFHLLGIILSLTACTAAPTPSVHPTSASSPSPLPTNTLTPIPLPAITLPAPVRSLATDPNDLRAAYALLDTGHLYRTINYGQTWELLPLPMNSEAANDEQRQAGSIALAQQDVVPHYNIAGLIFVRTGETIYRSEDGGQTWQELIEGVTVWTVQWDEILAWRPDPPGEERGLYLSADKGDTWQNIYEGFFPPSLQNSATRPENEGILSLAINPNIGNNYFAGTAYGIYEQRSSDLPWQEFNTGLPASEGEVRWVPSLAFSGGYLYALTEQIMGDANQSRHFLLARLGRDFGEDNWQVIGDSDLLRYTDPAGAGFYGVYSLVPNPARPEELFLATDTGVLISGDHGESWGTFDMGKPGSVYRLAVAPGVRFVLYGWGEAGLTILALDPPAPVDLTPTNEVALGIVAQTGGDILPPIRDGNIAFLTRGPRLYAIDITDPNVPVLLGQSELLPGVPTHAFRSADMLYLAARQQGLLGVDISDPANLHWTTTVPVAHPIQQAYLHDGLAFLVENTCYQGCQGTVRIVDLSDPAPPNEIALLDMPASVYGLMFYENALYVEHVEGLQVIDISDPARLHDMGLLFELGSAGPPLVVSGQYAFMAGSGLHVVDLSDPFTPDLVAYIEGYGPSFQSITISEPYVFLKGLYCDVGTCMEPILVVNISDPLHPFVPAEAEWPDSPSEPDPLAGVNLESLFGPLEFTDGLRAADGRVYTLGEGYEVWDITDPAQPTSASHLPTLNWESGIAMDGGYAFVPNWSDGWSMGLDVYDITEPLTPELVAHLPYEEDMQSQRVKIIVEGERLYVFLYDEGFLEVVDISDPAHPVLLGTNHFPLSGFDIAVAGSLAYVTMHPYGENDSALVALDLSNPADIRELGSLPQMTGLARVRVVGEIADVFTNTLRTVDVSDPTQPRLLGEFELPATIEDVTIFEEYAIAAGSESGLWVIDVSDTTNMTLAAHFDTPGRAESVEVLGNRIYVADGEGGLLVLEPVR